MIIFESNAYGQRYTVSQEVNCWMWRFLWSGTEDVGESWGTLKAKVSVTLIITDFEFELFFLVFKSHNDTTQFVIKTPWSSGNSMADVWKWITTVLHNSVC